MQGCIYASVVGTVQQMAAPNITQ